MPGEFWFVTPRVATGAHVLSRDDVVRFKAAGITHVINCQGEVSEGPFYEGTGIELLEAGLPDDGKPRGPEYFGRAISWALDALSKPGARVHAHCMGGSNRGPSMSYAILRALGFPPDAARAAILAVRPEAQLAYARDADSAIAALGYGAGPVSRYVP